MDTQGPFSPNTYDSRPAHHAITSMTQPGIITTLLSRSVHVQNLYYRCYVFITEKKNYSGALSMRPFRVKPSAHLLPH